MEREKKKKKGVSIYRLIYDKTSVFVGLGVCKNEKPMHVGKPMPIEISRGVRAQLALHRYLVPRKPMEPDSIVLRGDSIHHWISVALICFFGAMFWRQ